MKIIVCVKQVPDTKGGVKFNPDGTLDRGAMLTIMNPDDKAGLEAALRLKDQYLSLIHISGVLQYAQTIFEGMKAYTTEDGRIVTFRPDLNASRFADSARRLEMQMCIRDRT